MDPFRGVQATRLLIWMISVDIDCRVSHLAVSIREATISQMRREVSGSMEVPRTMMAPRVA